MKTERIVFEALRKQFPDLPYVTVAQETEDYAKTNYPGIPPANPVKDARPLLLTRQKAAWEEMQAIIKLLERYREQHGEYPSTAQGLAALQPFTTPAIPNVPLQDPWGHNFAYACPGEHGAYDLQSYGADGQPGGTDENADVTSWAEASLIGTWYEYTPTTALDIAFAEIMPSA